MPVTHFKGSYTCDKCQNGILCNRFEIQFCSCVFHDHPEASLCLVLIIICFKIIYLDLEFHQTDLISIISELQLQA